MHIIPLDVFRSLFYKNFFIPSFVYDRGDRFATSGDERMKICCCLPRDLYHIRSGHENILQAKVAVIRNSSRLGRETVTESLDPFRIIWIITYVNVRVKKMHFYTQFTARMVAS